jgi:hypothetical protein
MMRGANEATFEVALHEWDTHVDRCVECLTDGMNLCYEGQFLTEEIVETRQAIAIEAGVTSPTRPFRGPQRAAEPSGVAA